MPIPAAPGGNRSKGNLQKPACNRTCALSLGALFVAVLVFFWPVVLRGDCPLGFDIWAQTVPWKVYIKDSLVQLRLPLWKFLVSCIAGKVLKNILFALAGFYGVAALFDFFQ